MYVHRLGVEMAQEEKVGCNISEGAEAVGVIVLFASHKWKDWIIIGWERWITVYKLEKRDGGVG